MRREDARDQHRRLGGRGEAGPADGSLIGYLGLERPGGKGWTRPARHVEADDLARLEIRGGGYSSSAAKTT